MLFKKEPYPFSSSWSGYLPAKDSPAVVVPVSGDGAGESNEASEDESGPSEPTPDQEQIESDYTSDEDFSRKHMFRFYVLRFRGWTFDPSP